LTHKSHYTSAAGIQVTPTIDLSLASLSAMMSDSSGTAGTVHPEIQAQLSASDDYDADITVLGSGPAGYFAAIRAAQLGARIMVVEKGTVGGTCLNVGCIPTKTLLSCVAVLDNVKSGAEFGVKVDKFTLDIPTMMERKRQIVKQLVLGIESLFRKNRIRLIRGLGRIADPHTVLVQTEKGEDAIKTNKILICTGSTPSLLPLEGLEIGPNVWTSTEALEFDQVPKSLLVIGAGAIGLEAGYTFARLGSEVLVVEMMSQILPAADTETARTLQAALEHAGVKFLTGATVSRAMDTKTGKRAYIKTDTGEREQEFEKVLIAVGRRAVLDGIGLDEVGVKHDKRKILVNEHMQTNIPNIYAAGDCVGEPMLAHVGWAEGAVAVEHAMGMDSTMNYKAVPACVYTTPECASVGLTEEQARERYKDVRIGKFTFQHNGKAMGIGETEGFVKFVSGGRYGQILGVHMVGPHVTDMIAEAALAVKNELSVDEVIATIHPHPTLSEVVQEAAMDTLGQSIHK
jgi:dihydrolipoamide dehydrogenase